MATPLVAYTRITRHERCLIEGYLRGGYSLGRIACILRRSKSSISCEVHRKGMTRESYTAAKAEKDAENKRRFRGRVSKVRGVLKTALEILLPLRWSPEQISRYLKKRFPTTEPLSISVEGIYQYIYRFRKCGYARYLRRRRKKRRHKRISANPRRGPIRGGRSIRERDAEIELRLTPGHWEGDLIIGKGGQSAIATLVERFTRKVMIIKVSGRSSIEVVSALIERLSTLAPHMRKSLTYDRGAEMAQHLILEQATGMLVYFAHPGCPWERGTNENTNALIRDFFPKGTDFNLVTAKELAAVEELLNNRPRKVLGFRTPRECFDEAVAP